MALMLYQDYVRRWLLKLSGYECQQADGEFMLAFDVPINAVKFCLAVCLSFMTVCWISTTSYNSERLALLWMEGLRLGLNAKNEEAPVSTVRRWRRT